MAKICCNSSRPKFEVIRAQHQEIQVKNISPHHISQGGYLDEKLRQHQEASQSDPLCVFTHPSPIPRHEKWKKARHGGVSMQQVQQMIDAALQKQKEEFNAIIEMHMAKMAKQFSMNIPILQSHSEKDISPDPLANISDLGAQCQLFLEDPIDVQWHMGRFTMAK